MVVFGLPALVALLILPFIIIYTPFRWRKQTQRLHLIETRLGEVERSLKSVYRRLRQYEKGQDKQGQALEPVPEHQPDELQTPTPTKGEQEAPGPGTAPQAPSGTGTAPTTAVIALPTTTARDPTTTGSPSRAPQFIDELEPVALPPITDAESPAPSSNLTRSLRSAKLNGQEACSGTHRSDRIRVGRPHRPRLAQHRRHRGAGGGHRAAHRILAALPGSVGQGFDGALGEHHAARFGLVPGACPDLPCLRASAARRRMGTGLFPPSMPPIT